MRTLSKNLELRRGDDYQYRFSILGGDGIPWDFTDAVIELMVKKSYEDSDSNAVLLLTIGSGIEIVTLEYNENLYTNSKAIFTFTNAQTASLTNTPYVYDVIYNTEEDGLRYTVVAGKFTTILQVNQGN